MLGAQLVASIIEILPENHADPALNSNQRKGLSYYDRQGYKANPEQRGQGIDFYC